MSRTILLAEDDEASRKLYHALLESEGYQVVDVGDGKAALEVLKNRSVDLLVTDVVMPEMGGGELVERLTALRPDLKALYISGYTNDEVLSRGVQGAETTFLHKPFTSEGLMRVVRGVLDRGAPATT